MMNWLHKEALAPLLDDFKEVKRLLAVEDPDDRPYDSKYDARKILKTILEKVTREKIVFSRKLHQLSHYLGMSLNSKLQ